jgi:hypothetical protein
MQSYKNPTFWRRQKTAKNGDSSLLNMVTTIKTINTSPVMGSIKNIYIANIIYLI